MIEGIYKINYFPMVRSPVQCVYNFLSIKFMKHGIFIIIYIFQRDNNIIIRKAAGFRMGGRCLT